MRCRFEPLVPIGKKAVHRFAALLIIIASTVAITPAQAQTASELRIVSGTVEKLDGNLAALSLSQGISLVVRLDSEPRVNSVAKGSGSDLKAGSQVSIQAKSGQSGDLIATPIVLFAPGSNRPDAEPGPDNAQLVATIKKTNASPEGPVLTVADKDEDRKITIRPDTAIWIARAARITDIKVGSAVTMTGVKQRMDHYRCFEPPLVWPGQAIHRSSRASRPRWANVIDRKPAIRKSRKNTRQSRSSSANRFPDRIGF